MSSKRIPTLFFVLVTMLIVLWLPANHLRAEKDVAVVEATYVVNSVADPGDGTCNTIECTLREAIEAANASSGLDLIAFNIPGEGPHTIRPITPLPPITDSVIIDGYTQPGAIQNTNPVGQGIEATLMVELNGSELELASVGLDTISNDVEIRGLVINSFGTGIGRTLAGAYQDLVIAGNYIGTNTTGDADLGNQYYGILLQGGKATIGGTVPADRNLISGNSTGIAIVGESDHEEDVKIWGNLIGTDVTGVNAISNDIGIWLGYFVENVHVGGHNFLGQSNLISGNSTCAILFARASSSLVANNYIGTDVTGNNSLPNGCGIRIEVLDEETFYNEISHNRIANNLGSGIEIEGDDDPARNGHNRITKNVIYNNSDLGIELYNASTGRDGVTPNDPLDVDEGANDLQNYPELFSAVLTDNAVQIRGVLSSQPNDVFRIEFFANRSCDPSGHGEGEEYLGFDDLITNASGNAAFDITLSLDSDIGQYLAATATNADGATSEFSECLLIPSEFSECLLIPIVDITVNSIGDPGNGICDVVECTLREAITTANANPGKDLIAFNIPGDGPHTIQPLTPLPDITDSVIIDGYTQPGASPNESPVGLGIDATLMIELDGSFATGLRFLAADNEVCGLVLNRFPGPAVDLYHGGIDTLVAGNYIGTDVTGELNLGNGTGVSVDSFANGTVIGGLHPSLRNLLAGNGIGVQITNNHYEYSVVTVLGNLIGTNAAGTSAIPNGFGVWVATYAENNVIGGDDPGAPNVISGNSYCGVFLGLKVSNNHILNNYIGTDVSGNVPLPNGCGIKLEAGGGVWADSHEFARNTIAYNLGSGIEITGNDPPNAWTGGNTMAENSIFANGGLGIDLEADGVTLNDPGDLDEGANDLQNYPELTLAASTGSGIRIQGTLSSVPDSEFHLEFFANRSCDESGYGEGEQFLGSGDVTTGPDGVAEFDVIVPPDQAIGQFITATATNAVGSTSEFSECRWFGTVTSV
ncbi:MAG: CSLREA domain-containing protein, partial [Anaerolineae bacterium]|nr:CSLREA domain-containing protein [Anaerolineae bacterium]